MGLTPEDISERRGLALSTVKSHLYNAYAKGRELRIHDTASDVELAEIFTARAQLGGDPRCATSSTTCARSTMTSSCAWLGCTTGVCAVSRGRQPT